MFEYIALFLLVIFLSVAVYHVANLSTKETPFEEMFSKQKEPKSNNAFSRNEVQKKKVKKVKSKKEETSSHSMKKVQKISSSSSHHSNNLCDMTKESKEAQNVQTYTNFISDVSNSKVPFPVVLQEQRNIPVVKNADPKIKVENIIKETRLDATNKIKQNIKEVAIVSNESIIDIENKELERKNSLQKINKALSKKMADKNIKLIEVKAEVNLSKKGNKARNETKENDYNVKNDGSKENLGSKEIENTVDINKPRENNLPSRKRKLRDDEIELNHRSKNDHFDGKVKAKSGQKDTNNKNIRSDKLQGDFEPGLENAYLSISEKSLPSASTVRPLINKSVETLNENVLSSKEGKIKNDTSRVRTEINSNRKPKDVKRKEILTDDSSSKLLSVIQKCQLSGAEIEILIEALLNKHQQTNPTGGEWVAKGKILNPISQLKRQVEESDSKLKEHIETNHALSAKISELRADLNAEKSRSNTLRKQLDNSSALLQQKLDAASALHREQLLLQVNETKIALNKEYNAKLFQQQQSINGENEIQKKNFQASIIDLETKLQQVNVSNQESEIRYQQVQNALSDAQHQLQTLTHEREELVQTCHNYKQHLATLQEQTSQQDADYNSRLFEAQQQLSTSEVSNKQLISQLKNFSADKEILDQKLRNLENVQDLLAKNRSQLDKTTNEKMDFENRLRSTENESSNLNKLVKSQKLEIERLKEQNESLVSLNIRPALEGQENGGNHQESNNHEHFETNKNSKLKEDLDSFKREVKRSEAALTAVSAPPEVKPIIVEKIIEKVVQDPDTLRQLKESKEKNASLEKRIKELTEEKLSLENNLNSSSSVEDSGQIIQDLQLENRSLTEKISNYQSILSNTETLLKTLQKSVENEETTWQEKLFEKEELLRQLLVDKKTLTIQVGELTNSLQKIKDAEEMECELNSVKEKLALEEKVKLRLEKQLLETKEQLEAFNSTQISSNGHQNGSLNEDEISQADTSSLLSSQDVVVYPQADGNSIKKKKKSFFSKLIRKNNNKESEKRSLQAED